MENNKYTPSYTPTFKAEISQKYSLNQSSDVLIKKREYHILSTLYSIIVLLLDRVYN